MKPFLISISLLLTLSAGISLSAQKLYTWTDDNGVLHLSDQPPPEKDTVENVEVTRYNEKTPQELEAIQNEKEALRRKFDKEEQMDKARQAKIQAKEAEERARKTVQQALEEYEYNNEYIRNLTSTRNKRKQFRKRVERLKAETEASRAEAEAAVEEAEKAAQKARTAAQEAQIDPP
jgi:hypothetical protein